jgi:hypothetical protein
METRIQAKDRVRVSTHSGDIFVDVSCVEWEQGLGISLHPFQNYLELRGKDSQLCVFCFRCKGDKKNADLGWWQDAEVVFSRNRVVK